MRRWLRRSLHLDDPNAVPLHVRVSFALAWTLGGLGIGLFHPGWLRGAAFIGILAGMFGAGTLFWDAIIGPDHIGKLTNNIMQSGQQRELTKGDWRGLIGMTIFMLTCITPACVLTVSAYHSDHDGNLLIERLLFIVCVFVVVPLTAYYYYIKWSRNWFFRNAEYLKLCSLEKRERFVKSYLQRIAFASFILAGFLQMPSLLLEP